MNGFARPPSLLPPQPITVTSNEEPLRAVIGINRLGINAPTVRERSRGISTAVRAHIFRDLVDLRRRVEESRAGCHIRHISLSGEDVGTFFRIGVRGHLQGYFKSEVKGLLVIHVKM